MGSADREPGRRWRDTVRARVIDGEVVVEATTGALLSAHFSTAYTFEREGVQGPFAVTLDYRMTTTPARAIAAPEGAATPSRPRPMLDRQALLDGLGSVPLRRGRHD